MQVKTKVERMKMKKYFCNISGVNFIKILKQFLIVFIASNLQIYWSVGEISDHISSSSPSTGFVEDSLMMSFMTATLFLFILFLTSRIKDNYINKSIQFVVLISLWLFWSYTIFVDRESSWSSYDFSSEMYYTFTNSLAPAFLLATISILFLSKTKGRKNK